MLVLFMSIVKSDAKVNTTRHTVIKMIQQLLMQGFPFFFQYTDSGVFVRNCCRSARHRPKTSQAFSNVFKSENRDGQKRHVLTVKTVLDSGCAMARCVVVHKKFHYNCQKPTQWHMPYTMMPLHMKNHIRVFHENFAIDKHYHSITCGFWHVTQLGIDFTTN